MRAALELYAERGYAGTCLDAILERASSSKGAFYHHFNSKEDLTARALAAYFDGLLHDLNGERFEDRSPEEMIDGLLDRLEPLDAATNGCPIGLLGFEVRSLPALVQAALHEGLRRWLARIAEILLDAGVADPALATAFSERLFVVYEGGVLVERVSGSCGALKSGLRAWRDDVLQAAAAHVS